MAHAQARPGAVLLPRAQDLLERLEDNFGCDMRNLYYLHVAPQIVKDLLEMIQERLELFVKDKGYSNMSVPELRIVFDILNRLFYELSAYCEGASRNCGAPDAAPISKAALAGLSPASLAARHAATTACDTFLKQATIHWFAENARLLGPKSEYLQHPLVLRFLKEPLAPSDRVAFVARLAELSRQVVNSRMLLTPSGGSTAAVTPRAHNSAAGPIGASIRAFKMTTAGIGAAVATAAAESAVASGGSGDGDEDDFTFDDDGRGYKRHRAR